MENNFIASVVIPVKNGGGLFKSLLDSVFAQKFDNYEVVIIDSGSTDGTVDLIKKYPARLIQIKPEEFGHGKTRNYGAKLAKGKYVVFLTADSIPSNNNWLRNMIAPFKGYNIAGVYGRQYPKPNENPLDKYFFLSLYGDKDIVWTTHNCVQGDNVFSDANSAVRRDLLIKYPYKNDIIVSEDYEWAFRILPLGYKIYYNSSAQVTHSHSYNLYTLFKRNFDVGVSYKTIYNSQTKSSIEFIKKGLIIYLQEIYFHIRSKNPHFIIHVTARDIIRLIAINFGEKEHLISKELKKKYLSGQKWYWV